MVNTTSVAPISGLGLRFLEWSKEQNVATTNLCNLIMGVYAPIAG